MLSFYQGIVLEAWTSCALGLVLVALRIYARRIQQRTWNLRFDDWLMLSLVAPYVADMWAITEVAYNGSNYLSPEQAAALDPAGVRAAVYGSKMTLVVEMCTLACEWGAKACLCIFFFKLTDRVPFYRRFVIALSVYCAVAYALIVSLFLGFWCKPFTGYWAVPVQDDQCATYYNHLIFACAWNIFGDLLFLGLSFALVWQLNMSLRRKIPTLAALSLGIFNILTAILNRYYNFAHPNSVAYLYWYVAEVSTSIYVVNFPMLGPLLSKMTTKFTSSKATIGTYGRSQPRERRNELDDLSSRATRSPKDAYSQGKDDLALELHERDSSTERLTPLGFVTEQGDSVWSAFHPEGRVDTRVYHGGATSPMATQSPVLGAGIKRTVGVEVRSDVV